jgi:DNA-binding PadR family transcriptional regulator
MTDLVMLAMLLPGPRHGYHLKHQAGLILGQEALHNNLVYPLLRRFTSKKWVSRRTVPGERGQMRQQYALTALGRKELIARLSSFTEQEARVSNAFRFRVGMFQVLEPEVRLGILDARERFLRARIEKLSSIQQNFALDRYAGEVTSRFCADSKAELEWIAHLRRLVRQEAT